VKWEWKWTETPEFREDCARLHDDPGEIDFIHWVITDAILRNPLQGSKPLFPFGDPSHNPWVRWFRTIQSPGANYLYPRIVIFRVEPEPAEEGVPRELTGLALLDDDDA
jgi:hypothetical protein